MTRSVTGTTPRKPAATRLPGSQRSGTPLITVLTGVSCTTWPPRSTVICAGPSRLARIASDICDQSEIGRPLKATIVSPWRMPDSYAGVFGFPAHEVSVASAGTMHSCTASIVNCGR